MTGPKGLNFARTRVEMKAAETILYLRQMAPKRMRSMIPHHVWLIAERYGLHPQAGETSAERIK